MSAVVSPDLQSRFEAYSHEPTHREQVVITLADTVDARLLEDAGFEGRFVTRDHTIAAGRLDRAALSRLAQATGVVAIEPDGEMHALDTEPPAD